MKGFDSLHIEIEKKKLHWIVFYHGKPYYGHWHDVHIPDTKLKMLIENLEKTIPSYKKKYNERDRKRAERKEKKLKALGIMPLYSNKDVASVLRHNGSDDAYKAMSELTGLSREELLELVRKADGSPESASLFQENAGT